MMRHYTFIDYATQSYIALVGLLILCFHNQTVPEWPALVALHAICGVLIHLLIAGYTSHTTNRSLRFLRGFYPVILYTLWYRETGAVNRMFITDYLDPVFIRLEQNIFGLQPSLAFMDGLPYLPLSEVFYAAYFSYYLMIVGVGFALYLRQAAHFQHYLAVMSFVFYLCYCFYIFLPVIGPRTFFREIEGYHLPPDLEALSQRSSFPDAVRAGPFYHLMAFIYHGFEAPGAAFPSSHVAVAICTLYFSFRYLRQIRYLHLTLVILLCLSTIYGRYHYALDVVAGGFTAAILIPLGNYLYRRAPHRSLTTGDTNTDDEG